jgi:hypothetical protein
MACANRPPRQPATWPRGSWLLALVLVSAAVGWAATAAADDPAPARGAVLDLPGGGTLPGTLLPAPPSADGVRDTLLWKSPLFAEPFEFQLDEIVGVRLAKPGDDRLAAPFRFRLRGGDALDGTLEAIDGETIAVVPSGAAEGGAVRIRRAILEGISRLGGATGGGYVGPGGLNGWDHRPAGAWRAEAGRIIATRPGAAAIDVGAGSRARYDIVLSWRRRPELRIAVAAAEKPGDDAFWVELLRLQDGTNEVAVVRQEADTAAIEPLAGLDPAARTLRLVIFVDQQRGRLAAFVVGDDGPGTAAQVVVPPDAKRPPSGRFRLTLGGGDVCIESLRVGPWTSDEPVLEDRSRTAVVARDGSVVEANVESFDKAMGELVLAAASGRTRMRLDDIGEIRLPGADAAAVNEAAPAALRAVLAAGSTVAGRLDSIDERSLRLRVEGIDDVLALPLEEVASLTALRTAPAAETPPPGRIGALLADGVSVRGRVVDGGPWSSGIAWQPLGSTTASPLAAGDGGQPRVTIEYVPRPGREPVGEAQVEVGGIGGMVNQDAQGFFVVTMLSEDGAAALDGRLQPGDRLLAIKPRPEGGFVPTKGLDVTTVMNLLRGRVGSPIVLRVKAAADPPREIDLKRGLIYVAGRDVLDQALATHEKYAVPAAVRADDAGRYPSLVILRSGDVVPCEVVAADAKGLRLRTPLAEGGEPVAVSSALVQAVELDPSAPSRTIEKARLERLLTLPRSQRVAPPTHMIRLRDGDYLRGRLESLDADTLVVDVRGEVKKLPRASVARVIWLEAEPAAGDAGRSPAAVDRGVVVQGVAAGRRVTAVAEGVDDSTIRGVSPAVGPVRIDLKKVDRLLVGRAIEDEADELPYRQWRLKPAPEPRALREADAAPQGR